MAELALFIGTFEGLRLWLRAIHNCSEANGYPDGMPAYHCYLLVLYCVRLDL